MPPTESYDGAAPAGYDGPEPDGYDSHGAAPAAPSAQHAG